MGKATGKTFEEFVEGTNALNVFLAQDRINSLGRSEGASNWAITTRQGRRIEFAIKDADHDYAKTTGLDFARLALLWAMYLMGGGTGPFVDLFHDDED